MEKMNKETDTKQEEMEKMNKETDTKQEIQTFTLDGKVYPIDAKDGVMSLLEYIGEVEKEMRKKQFDFEISKLAHENLILKLKEIVSDIEPLEVNSTDGN